MTTPSHLDVEPVTYHAVKDTAGDTGLSLIIITELVLNSGENKPRGRSTVGVMDTERGDSMPGDTGHISLNKSGNDVKTDVSGKMTPAHQASPCPQVDFFSEKK